MHFIHNTTSLCNHCYKHIRGIVYEHDGTILLTKRCPLHGEMTSVVEIDPEFYYSLESTHLYKPTIMFEVTDKCQLACPHCYHLPDNQVQDTPIETIINKLNTYPSIFHPLMAGAEPTLRKDFFELTNAISTQVNSSGKIMVLTNGVKFSSHRFTRQSKDAGLKVLNIGLNHDSYQGKKVHDLQLKGIRNAVEEDFVVGYVGYTIEDLSHLEDILNEIRSIDHDNIVHYRIRCGSFIGRSSDQERSYVSRTVKRIKEILGDEVEIANGLDNNIYHVNLLWKGKRLRIIQWPDVTNIDLEELLTGPYCNFYDGPITNFVHQVILRDAFKNMKLIKLDEAPKRYHYNPTEDLYWKRQWTGPTEMTKLSWDWDKFR